MNWTSFFIGMWGCGVVLCTINVARTIFRSTRPRYTIYRKDQEPEVW